MIDNKSDFTKFLEYLESELPKIEGVEWKIDSFRSNRGTEVGLSAVFVLPNPVTCSQSETYAYAGNKIHQITSGGQVKLELEHNGSE
jgi:hypothetical protein